MSAEQESDVELRLQALREVAQLAQGKLHRAVVNACPKPHKVVQHRDAQPPWCETCGRGADGKMWSTR